MSGMEWEPPPGFLAARDALEEEWAHELNSLDPEARQAAIAADVKFTRHVLYGYTAELL